MGILDDMGRLFDAAKDAPRPTISEGIKQAADSAEQAKAYREAAAAGQGGFGAASANPFANAAAMNAGLRGSGTVVSIADTSEKFAEASIYAVTMDVTADGIPPYQVVHRQLIAAAALGNWQPGKVIGLRIDPNDHQSVMLG